MTLEETSEILKSIKLNGGLTDKDRQALNVVIQMLETGEVYMTGEDYNLYIEGYKAGMKDYKSIVEENERLKKDQRPEGEWESIKKIDDDAEYGEIDAAQCSICKHTEDSEYWAKTYYNFCPNCGARMVK